MLDINPRFIIIMKFHTNLKSKCLVSESTSVQRYDLCVSEKMTLEYLLGRFSLMDNISAILGLLEGVESRLKRQTDQLREIRTELSNIEVHLDAAREEPLMLLSMKRARAIRKTKKRRSIVEVMVGLDEELSDAEMDVEVAIAGVQRTCLKNFRYREIVSGGKRRKSKASSGM